MIRATTEPKTPKDDRCHRCGGELAAWTMARGTLLYCGWYRWSADPPAVEGVDGSFVEPLPGLYQSDEWEGLPPRGRRR